MKPKRSAIKKHEGLICADCGNNERFIEVMAEEAHLVNHRKDYIRLLVGIADHYLCWKCGAEIHEETSTNK
jgi:hypothetical protein